MSISYIRTLLPLAEYARIMAIPGWLFCQLEHPLRVKRGCEDVLLQSGYSGNPNYIVGRDEIATAIFTAEQRIAAYLGFWPAPTWIAREQVEVPLVHLTTQFAWMNTRWGYLIAAGTEAWEIVASNVTVNYTSPDGDAIDEWASITFNTTVTDTQEIAVVPHGYNPRLREWRIRPLQVAITAGVATAQGWSWLFADPTLWLNPDPGELGTDQLATVDVYRHYNKTFPTQASYEWLPDQRLCAVNNTTCTSVCQSACVVVGDERIGQFYAKPATWSGGAWNNATWVGTTQPSSLWIWYYAGFRDPMAFPGEVMGENLKTAIVRLANCYLPEAPCGCSFTAQRWEQDRQERDVATFDIAMTQNNFGTTMAGAIYARSVCASIPPLGQGG